MCQFIGLENIVGNALIYLFENFNKREVSFENIVKYSNAVTALEKEQGREAIVLLSREYQLGVQMDYAEYFNVDFSDSNNCIFSLVDGMQIEKLKCAFQHSLNIDLYKTLTSERTLKMLIS